MKSLLSVLLLAVLSLAPSAQAIEKPSVLVLQKKNTLVLRGVVTQKSIAKLQLQLNDMSAALNTNETIYLVLDTPGGDVDAGLKLIDTINATPQKIKTLTLFAASMGFHIVQNADERLVLPSSTLMSHRASISGLGGELPGELISFLGYIMRQLTGMDQVVADRMKAPLNYYQNLIRDELWLGGPESLKYRLADRVVLARCDSSFKGTALIEIGQFLGVQIMGEMSNCPLVTGVLGVTVNGPTESLQEAKEFGLKYSMNRIGFVKSYISNGKLLYNR